MAAIAWDQTGDRVFETGLDRAVLYFPDGGGVPWNGLISVNEKNTTEVDAVYFDGIKFNDIVVIGDYSATLRAYTYPEEFMEFEGIIAEQTGMYVANQPARLFHLSYRTRVGNDINGPDDGYKIHMLWNLIAVPSNKSYQTLSLQSEPTEFEWDLTSIPEEIEKYRPTSHIILDSRKLDPMLMRDIEVILYGDVDREPIMPSLKGFTSFVRKWERIIVVDNGDGTWSATSDVPGVIEMVDATTFQINNANATYLDLDTFEIQSSEKNEEDIY